MMKEKISKLGILFMAIVLMVSAVTGCGTKNEGEKVASTKDESGVVGENEIAGKGRYVETELALPEGILSSDIEYIGKKEDTLYFLTNKNENEITKFQEFTLDKSTGTFQETTQDWLKEIEIPYWGHGICNLLYSKDQVYLYAIYYEEGGELYRSHIFSSADGIASKEVSPESWGILQEEYLYYETPEAVNITQNNQLIAQYYDRVEIYDMKDSSLLTTIPLKETYLRGVQVKDHQLYLVKGNQTGVVSGVEVYEIENPKEPTVIPLELKNASMVYLDIMEDGKLIVCGKPGFLERKPESSEWIEIIPGAYTSLSFVDMWCSGMVALSNGNFYTLLAKEGGDQFLMEYQYDAEMEINNTATLNIYTVNPSSVLEQAIALYQKNHPEVKIELETVLSYDDMYSGSVDMNTVYSNLNTKLLSGEGPDILIMDELDMDSYVEKGLLVDINELVTSLEESGEVLSNITGSYRSEDGKRYVMPLRFSLTLLVGKGIDATTSNDFESLVKAISNSDKNVLGPRTPEDLTGMFAPFFLGEVIQGKELNKETLIKYLGYLKELGEAGGMVKEYNETTRGWSIWDIAAEAQACFALDEGFKQAMLPLSGVKLVNGTYDVFDNTFFPMYEAGIFSKSENQELAMDFLKFAVSKEVQNSDFYDGYPINASSLEYQAKSDRKDAEAYSMISLPDGSSIEFEIKIFEEKEANKLVELASKVDQRAYIDPVVETEIAAVLAQLVDGSMSVEQAADKVEGALKMYLAE